MHARTSWPLQNNLGKLLMSVRGTFESGLIAQQNANVWKTHLGIVVY